MMNAPSTNLHTNKRASGTASRSLKYASRFNRRTLQTPGKAFTLVELMVVVVILGVLATIVTVNVTDYLVKGKRSAAKAEIAQLSNALQLYYSDHDRYPGNEEGLELLTAKSDAHPNGMLSGDLLDPWGTMYTYIYPGLHGVFDICSFGANGQEGGSGADTDVCNWSDDAS